MWPNKVECFHKDSIGTTRVHPTIIPRFVQNQWDKDALEQDITYLTKHIFPTRSTNNIVIPNSMTKPFAIEF
jgi:hypothetical protein